MTERGTAGRLTRATATTAIPGVFPGAAEACDGRDNDCDQATDEACRCAGAAFRDSAYLLCTDALTWSEALSSCEARGYTLATVNDERESAFLLEQIASYPADGWFTGLSDTGGEGSWTWVSGQNPVWRNWRKGEPDGSTAYNCMTVRDRDGTWEDASCTQPEAFLCER